MIVRRGERLFRHLAVGMCAPASAAEKEKEAVVKAVVDGNDTNRSVRSLRGTRPPQESTQTLLSPWG